MKVAFEFSEKRKPGTRRLEAVDATAGVDSPPRCPGVRKGQLSKQNEMA